MAQETYPAVHDAINETNDPHGNAALLLVESLIHGLCEKSLLSTAEAIEIIDRAIEVQEEQAEVADAAAVAMWRAHGLLSSIASSLRRDDIDDPVPPDTGR